MITIIIPLSPDKNGESSYITTQAHKSACPGVVITHPFSYMDYNDNPVFKGTWVFVHQTSGWIISNHFWHIQDARNAAKRLLESGLDFTQSIEHIQNNYHQYRKAILHASE